MVNYTYTGEPLGLVIQATVVQGVRVWVRGIYALQSVVGKGGSGILGIGLFGERIHSGPRQTQLPTVRVSLGFRVCMPFHMCAGVYIYIYIYIYMPFVM